MNEPIPTPYDIVPIPHIPWEPGTSVWGIAAGVFAAVVLLIFLARFFSRGNAKVRALRPLLSELSKLSTPRTSVACERFTRLARRILSFLVGLDLSGYSADELRKLAAATSDGSEAEVLVLIAQLEDLTYAPDGVRDEAGLPSLAREVVHALNRYVGSMNKS